MKDGIFYLIICIIITILTSVLWGLILTNRIEIISIIANVMIQTIVVFFTHIVMFITAKILGGKGSFGKQLHMILVASVPLTFISFIILLIFFIVFGPVLGFLFIAYVIIIFISLYAIYLTIIALRETHSYSTFKAVITLITPIVIIIVIFLLLIIFLFVFLFGVLYLIYLILGAIYYSYGY
ncbi:MAG: YIP1 family protein [Candidatus Anstonellales archaeon]